MKRCTLSLAAIILLLSTIAATPVFGHRVRVVHRHGHHVHFAAGGHLYHPRVVRVARVDYGTVDFNVRPQKSRIYVDGDYLGIADDFNGYPQKARLSAGKHRVRVVSPSGQVEVRTIYVAAGRELNFNLTF